MAGQKKSRTRRAPSAYRATLNLPRTDFPMRANLPVREVEILHLWEQIDLYASARERAMSGEPFLLHDGPPFCDDDIHLGHALNKILKDVVIKFRSMQGYDVPFVPGWDTHGLTTEIQAIQKMAKYRTQIPVPELRRRCAAIARKQVNRQREQFKRLGVRGDWERAYLTMQPEYAGAVLDLFADLVERQLIYQGMKPVNWCTKCQTTLAEAEIVSLERELPSAYVAFPAVALPQGVLPGHDPSRLAAVIRTTAPWTLPASVALAVHPDLIYVMVTDDADTEGFTYLVARDALAEAARAMQWATPRILGEVRGAALAGARFLHPFLPREIPLILAESVGTNEGTGLQPLAPDHGKEDYAIAIAHDLPLVQCVGPDGRFGPEAGPVARELLDDAHGIILERLDSDGTLLGYSTQTRLHPHCWRCETPLIVRATPQWFLAVTRLADTLPARIDSVQWVPAWGRDLMRSMTAERPDWCLSRQRAWGTPIPIFLCEGCGEPLVDAAVIRHVAEKFRNQGVEHWFSHPVHDLLPPETACARCGAVAFRWDKDVFDVWFESGCSQRAVPAAHPELRCPADLYLEGQDQFRGWFQASLLIATALGAAAPFRTVYAHGFVLDAPATPVPDHQGADTAAHHGHSRDDNTPQTIIDPQAVVHDYGADILRLWAASVDTHADVVISHTVLAQTVERYRRLRNTLRYLLGNLYDFDPATMPMMEEPTGIDRWALHRLNAVVREVTRHLDAFALHRATHTLVDFCATELSACYLASIKDRLYAERADAPTRRAAQRVLYILADTLLRLLAPIISFTADDAWMALPGGERPLSAQLAAWPTPNPAWDDAELDAQMTKVLAVCDAVNAAMTAGRAAGSIDQAATAKVTIYLAGETLTLLESWEDILAAALSVAVVNHAPEDDAPATAWRDPRLAIAVTVTTAPGSACLRCRQWRRVGVVAAHPGLCQRCAATMNAVDLESHTTVE